jgi:acyl carrier protein
MQPIGALKDTFVEALGVDPKTDLAGLSYGSTRQWDSVAHMSLIAGIESRFNVSLDIDDVMNLGSFEKAKDILEKHGVTFGA